MDDVNIYNEEIVEFEYDTFSVFYNSLDKVWFLETYGDDDEREEIMLENEKEQVDFSIDELRNLNFTEEEFLKLKTFLKDKK